MRDGAGFSRRASEWWEVDEREEQLRDRPRRSPRPRDLDDDLLFRLLGERDLDRDLDALAIMRGDSEIDR